MSNDKKKNLGRGLSALLGDDDESETGEVGSAASEVMVPITSLQPSRFQPRSLFDPEAITDLAASIREKGIIQPILVRPSPDGDDMYEIIAGERRWRAAQQAQLHEVPVLVRHFNDRETAEIALVENLQRQDLSPLEEAEGYLRLMDEFEHTQEALGKVLGKSRSHIANTLRLLQLPEGVKALIAQGSLSAGHGRALIGCDDAVSLAQQVVKKGLNVRQTETLVKKAGGKAGRKPTARKAAVEKDTDTLALERDLTNLLGLAVSIDFDGQSGRLSIRYDTLEQLDDILHRLTQGGQAGPELPESDLSTDVVDELDDESVMMDDTELAAELESLADTTLGKLPPADEDLPDVEADMPLESEEIDDAELDAALTQRS